MGRSASRLNRTRSGVVREALLLGLRTLGFSPAAPIPPDTLFHGQAGIARLRHRGAEHVLHAYVLTLAGDAAQLCVHGPRLRAGKLRDAANPQHFEIAKHGWAY